MSWTKSEKMLVLIVFGILFLIINLASFFIIKNILNVSIYEEKYDQEQKRHLKSLGSKCIPFTDLQ